MELNKTSTLVVKKWIEDKRIALVNEMTAIKARIDVYTQMLKELEQQQPIVSQPRAIRSFTGSKSVEMLSSTRSISKGAEQVALLALEAAGSRGLTARELAEVAHIPTGTASGRLTVMKAKGLANHVQPRYFAVHSQQQDNNVEQGDMQ